MLKPYIILVKKKGKTQPPSGGCVLKLFVSPHRATPWTAAAFGRLCVETILLDVDFESCVRSRLRAAVC